MLLLQQLTQKGTQVQGQPLGISSFVASGHSPQQQEQQSQTTLRSMAQPCLSTMG